MGYVWDLKCVQPRVRCRIFDDKAFKLVFILCFPQNCSSSKWIEDLPGYAGLIPWGGCLLVLKKLLCGEGNLIYFSYIRERRIWETHLFLIQTSLNIQGSEGKPFCSTSCNQTPIAMAARYNGLEPFTFGDAWEVPMHIIKTGGKGDFQLQLIICMGRRNRQAGRERTFTQLCTITFLVLMFS